MSAPSPSSSSFSRPSTPANPIKEGQGLTRLLGAALLVAAMLPACTLPTDPIVQPVASVQAAAPVYPLMARRYGIEGAVRVRFCVQADGTVVDVHIQQSSSSAELDGAAVDAVKRSRFRPAQTASGMRVQSCISAPYRFVLE